MNDEKNRKILKRSMTLVTLSAMAASAYVVREFVLARPPAAASADVETRRGTGDARPEPVACLGRFEPQDGVMHVAGALLNVPHAPVVETLRVRQGDHIRRGTLIATFMGRAQLAAALEQAQAQISVARRRLEQVKAGVRQSEVAAYQAEVARLETALEHAQTELRRYETLRRTDDVTASELDARRTAAQEAQRAVEQARNHLQGLREVPAVDIQLAQAELQAAIANAEHVRSDYEAGFVYAPIDGEVLRVDAFPGEEAGAKGVIEMGRTERLYVVAEVYETDIGRVRVGQRAEISGDLLTTPLSGVVERIDHNIRQASVLPGDTASFADNRIVETRIRLDRGASGNGESGARLIDGKVTVVIRP